MDETQVAVRNAVESMGGRPVDLHFRVDHDDAVTPIIFFQIFFHDTEIFPAVIRSYTTNAT